MLSAVSKNPVMPSVNGVTYSSYRVVGYIKTSFSTPDITPFNVSGSSNDRTHLWATDQTGLLGGTATTLTPVSLAEGIPSILGISDAAPQSVAAIFTMSLNPTGAGDNGQLWTFDTSINASSVLLGQVVGVLIQGQYVCAADFTNTGDYQIRYIITSTTGATLDIDIDGFTYTI
jgi:hypothetical protein